MKSNLSSHADALYKNLHSVKNRYQMLKTMKYGKLEEMDRKTLESFRDDWRKPTNAVFQFTAFQVYSKSHWNSFPHRKTFAVSVNFQVRELQLEEREKHKFLLLVQDHYDKSTDRVSLSCSRFPMQSQNEKFLRDTIKRLIVTATQASNE